MDRNVCAPKKGCFVWRMTKRVVKLGVVLTILAIPTVFFGLPIAAKTEWGRAKVERALERVAGGPVHVEKVEFSWKTGLTLTNVRADAVRRDGVETSGTVREIVVAPRLKTLFCKTTKANVTLRRPNVAIMTYADSAAPAAANPPAVLGRCCAKKPLSVESLRIEDGSITYDGDAMTEPLIVSDLKLNGAVRAKNGEVDFEIRSLTAKVNGGDAAMSGAVSVVSRKTKGRIEATIEGVVVTDTIVRGLERLVPALHVMPQGYVTGRVSGSLALEGACGELTGRGELTLDGKVSGSRMMQAVADVTQDSRVAGLEFQKVLIRARLDAGVISHTNTELRSEKGAARLTGTVARDGAIEMILVCDHDLVHEFAGKAEAHLIEGLRFTGTAASPQPVME